MEPVFIVGTGRTGSTVLMESLNSNSHLYVLPETKFIRPLYEFDVRNLLSQNNNDCNETLDGLRQARVDARYWREVSDGERQIDWQVLEDILPRKTDSVYDLLSGFLEERARKVGTDRVGAKFPVHLEHTEALMTAFPDSRIIHITRDPRASAASSAHRFPPRVDELSPVPIPHSLGYNLLFLHKAREFRLAARIHDHLGDKNNYHLLHFEDLVKNPEESLQRLCCFLGIGYESSMLKVNRVTSSYSEEPSESSRGFDSSAVDSWRGRIGVHHQKLMEFLTMTSRRKLGY